MSISRFNFQLVREHANNASEFISEHFWKIFAISCLVLVSLGGNSTVNVNIADTVQTNERPIEKEDIRASNTLKNSETVKEKEDNNGFNQKELFASINTSLKELSNKEFESYTSYSSEGASKSDIRDLGLATKQKQDSLKSELDAIKDSSSESSSLLGEQVQDQAESETLFGELITANRNVEIDLVSDQGTSVLRDVKITNGSASIPQMPASTGELRLKTGTQNNSRAVLETANLGRYSPGSSAQMGIGFRELEKPTGDQYWRAGLFGEQDGFFMGRNSSCLYVATKSEGEIKKSVCRENWNGEDVESELGRDWSPQDGTIIQLDFSWYGYGAIRFSVVETNNITTEDDYSIQNTVAVHTFTPEGKTSISDPIQPLRVETFNGNTSEDYEVRVGGRQFSILGPTSKVTRISNDGVTQQTVDSSDFECLVSFKKDSSDAAGNTEAQFYGVQGMSSSESIELGVFYNADLTSTGNYKQLENTPDRETSLLANRNCELASSNGEEVGFAEPNGTEIWNQYVSASTGFFTVNPGSSQVNGLNIKLPKRRNMVLAARSLDGVSTDVSANMRFIERK